MRLHSYVLDHDFGFAPNPFHGVCTLATCKPKIRLHAAVGDYIVGTGCAKRGRRGYLVYFMRVEEITTYNTYWRDRRFSRKRPDFHGSRMYAYGDNIYHQGRDGKWRQAPSFHSLPNGQPNLLNLEHDTTTTDRVLISQDFAYWGGHGPKIPARLRSFEGVDLCAGRGHKNSQFSARMIEATVAWLRGLDEWGFVAAPLEWN